MAMADADAHADANADADAVVPSASILDPSHGPDDPPPPRLGPGLRRRPKERGGVRVLIRATRGRTRGEVGGERRGRGRGRRARRRRRRRRRRGTQGRRGRGGRGGEEVEGEGEAAAACAAAACAAAAAAYRAALRDEAILLHAIFAADFSNPAPSASDCADALGREEDRVRSVVEGGKVEGKKGGGKVGWTKREAGQRSGDARPSDHPREVAILIPPPASERTFVARLLTSLPASHAELPPRFALAFLRILARSISGEDDDACNEACLFDAPDDDSGNDDNGDVHDGRAGGASSAASSASAARLRRAQRSAPSSATTGTSYETWSYARWERRSAQGATYGAARFREGFRRERRRGRTGIGEEQIPGEGGASRREMIKKRDVDAAPRETFAAESPNES
ncbi:hypothetical protein ACHAWF_017714 [Thalassiosira exigua]